MINPDVIIIGSGIGGSTMAAALAPTGKQILILERGDHLKPSAQDRSDTAIFADGYFRPKEEWLDGKGKPFNPGNYYYVGGNSKFYGAVLIRYRREDFFPASPLGRYNVRLAHDVRRVGTVVWARRADVSGARPDRTRPYRATALHGLSTPTRPR